VLLEVSSSTVFSYTEKFDWICKEEDYYIVDSDGKSFFSFYSLPFD